jgi:membrane protease YdiL (CAAX protease family)
VKIFFDRRFILFLSLGPIVSLILQFYNVFTISTELKFLGLINFILIIPCIEELIFRGLIQSKLEKFRFFAKKIADLSMSNLSTSMLFAFLHFYIFNNANNLLTFFPSLIFGYSVERYKSILPAILLHSFYNLCFYLAPLILASIDLAR